MNDLLKIFVASMFLPQAVESIIGILTGSLFLISMVFLHPATPTPSDEELFTTNEETLLLAHATNARMVNFLSSENEASEQFIVEYSWVAYTAGILIVVLGFLGFACTTFLGAYRVELSAEKMFLERKLFWSGRAASRPVSDWVEVLSVCCLKIARSGLNAYWY